MFDLEFLRKYPEFATSEGIQRTLLPPRMKPKPLEEVIRDDEELDTKIKSEKKKVPESPESLVFAKVYLPPYVWFQINVANEGLIQIVDVTPDHFQSILALIKEHFIPIEPLCKSMRLQDDEEGFADLVRQIIFVMNGSVSLAALDPSKTIVGVLIGKVEDADECTEKAIQSALVTSKRLQTMNNLITFVTKSVNMFEKYNCKTYYRIYILAMHQDWQNKGIEKALITAAMKLSSIMKISRIGGSFTLYKDQYYFKQFGAKTELEVYFSEWRTDRGLRIFRGTGKTEPKMAFLSVEVPENFLSSAEEAQPLEPLTSERARRFIKKRLHIWDELDIYRACQCNKNPDEQIRPNKKKMRRITRPLVQSLTDLSSSVLKK